MTEPKSCCHDYFSVCDVLERKAIKGVVSAEPTMTVRDAAARMLSAGVGSLLVLEGPRLVGIITDGDLRRALQQYDNVLARQAGELMTKSPIRVPLGTLAIDALHVMEDRPSQIMVLPVVDADGKAVGLLRVHDIVKAGL